MKKSIGIAVTIAAIFATVTAIAQTRKVPASTVPVTDQTTVFVKPICKFGLQFLVSTIDKKHSNAGAGGVAMIQVMNAAGNPMQCVEE